MTTLVLKFGGTSVASPQHLLGVAKRILEERRRGRRILVVVSAMGQTTDELISLARRVNPNPPRREMDMLVSTGERISMALLAMALHPLDIPAISFTGSQSGIITDDRHSDARIVAIRPFRIEEELERDRVVIVAGFQGVSMAKEITTLGRGGSDTTAVALAIRFGCPWVEIYTDVHGVMSADPRVVPHARTLPRIGYEEMIALSHLGAQVMFRRSVILARKYDIPVRVRSSVADGAETWIGRIPKEVSMEDHTVPAEGPTETDRVISIALERKAAFFEIRSKADPSTLLAHLNGDENPPPWSWIDIESTDGEVRLRGVRPDGDEIARFGGMRGASIDVKRDLSLVSLVSEGICDRPDLLREAIDALGRAGVTVRTARTSSLYASFLVDATRADEAVRALHARFVET